MKLSKQQINTYILFLELLLLQDEEYLFTYKDLLGNNMSMYCGLCGMLLNNMPVLLYNPDKHNLIRLFKLNIYKGNINPGVCFST